MEKSLPAIPAKRYFTIGEVSELCGVKPYVLRYWEQEFTQLRPMKRRGNRRYYQHHEVLLVRRIRELLYDQGFTISGARNRLGDAAGGRGDGHRKDLAGPVGTSDKDLPFDDGNAVDEHGGGGKHRQLTGQGPAEAGLAVVALTSVEDGALAIGRLSLEQLRQELISIRGLLTV